MHYRTGPKVAQARERQVRPLEAGKYGYRREKSRSPWKLFSHAKAFGKGAWRWQRERRPPLDA